MEVLKNKIAFSAKRIVIKDGTKHYEYLPKAWEKLTESNITPSHKMRGILTGEKNNLTVIDFDDKIAHDNFVEKAKEFNIDLTKYFNVDTRQGKHYYFEYVPDFKNASNIYTQFAEKGVDCRNNGGFITAPPTTYYDEDDNVCEYKYVGGTIQSMPDVMRSWFVKPKKEVTKKTKKDKEEKVETTLYETAEAICNLLPEKYYDSGCYSNWVKVGLALYNTDKDFKEIFYHFSLKSKDFEEYEVRDAIDKFWDNIKEKDNKLTFGSLVYWAREENPLAVSQILKSRKGGEQTDVSEAKYLLKVYPHFKFVNNELWAFDRGIWTNNKMIHQKIVMENAREKYAENANAITNLLRVLPSLCIDEDFFNRLEGSSRGKLLFKNGIYYSEDNSFVDEFDPNILFTGRIEFDMDKPDEEYINDIYQRMYVNTLDVEQAQYLCNQMSTALMGIYQKSFTFCIGTNGDNGKSLFVDAINNAFSQLTGSFEPENVMFRPNSSQEKAQKYRWALLNRYKRILMSSEMNAIEYKFDSEMMKKISGGDSLNGRVMCGNDVTFKPDFNMFFFANDIAKFLPLDKSVQNRLRVINFKYQFVDEPTEWFHRKKDDNLGKKEIYTEEFKKAFIYLHIRNFQLNCKNGFSVPDECINFADEVMGDEKAKSNLTDLFKEAFELDENSFISNKDFEEWIKEHELQISPAKLTIEIKRFYKQQIDDGSIKNGSKKIDKKTHRGFHGLKFIK